jgi:hypothetical protein
VTLVGRPGQTCEQRVRFRSVWTRTSRWVAGAQRLPAAGPSREAALLHPKWPNSAMHAWPSAVLSRMMGDSRPPAEVRHGVPVPPIGGWGVAVAHLV